MPKRKERDSATYIGDTPRKSRIVVSESEACENEPTRVHAADSPLGRRSILKSTPSKNNPFRSVESTPNSLRRVLFSTPLQPAEQSAEDEGTIAVDHNDRSARRKSQRALQHKLARAEEDSDEEHDLQDVAIAESILEEDGDSDDAEENVDVVPTREPSTPTKSGRPRGRPKGRRRERTPSPPPNLPPHELYFFQNRVGANKTSANTLPPNTLLNHDDYLAQIASFQDSHAHDMSRLKQLHKRAFDQWVFEFQEGFNICLYGYGSKRILALDFAEHLYHQSDKPPKILVVNGYSPGLTTRDIFTSLARTILPKTTKIPSQPAAILDLLLSALTSSFPKIQISLIIHSIDHANLRKHNTQTLLARLASHRAVSLLATCDTPNFPILWDVTLSSQYRFLQHDATTFAPYTAEIDVVEDVNALLGRSGRRLGGKDGVGYVLKSLPENARSLFRILVAEQLALGDVDGDIGRIGGGFGEDSDVEDDEEIIGVEDEEEAAAQQQTPSRRGRGRPPKKKKPAPSKSAHALAAPAVGVEYRTLYHRAVEDFVCSSEVNFRTLLKEFHDHQMIESRKDALGTERLIVPFRREELDGILEELV